MLRSAAWILAAAIAGCANAPADVRENGTRLDSVSSLSPLEAAHCLTRNAEAMTFGIGMKAVVSMRPAPKGAYEIVVSGTEIHGAMAYSVISPHGQGAAIATWYREWPPLHGAGELAKLSSGC